MSNLLFLRRSYEYRHAAAAAFRNARALPIGRERNVQRVLARGLRDLARTEAWLEGQRCHHPQFLRDRLTEGVGANEDTRHPQWRTRPCEPRRRLRPLRRNGEIGRHELFSAVGPPKEDPKQVRARSLRWN